jgi:LysM repeat protein
MTRGAENTGDGEGPGRNLKMDKKKQKHWLWIIGCMGIIGLITCVIITSVSIMYAINRGESPTSKLRVQIRLPRPGARLPGQEVQTALVQVHESNKIVRYELWVDGKLTTALRPTVNKPLLSNIANLQWIAESGGHVLVARAYDNSGRGGTSHPVVVEIVNPGSPRADVNVIVQPEDTLASIGEEWGVTSDEIQEANPNLQGEPNPGDDLLLPVPPENLPAEYQGDDPLGNLVPPPPPEPFVPDQQGEALPGSPLELQLSSTGNCTVQLQWTEVEGASDYLIHRFGPLSPDFVVVKLVDGTQNSYNDRVPVGGGYQYYIEAIGQEGSTEGPIAVINISAEECPLEAAQEGIEGILLLQFEGLRLEASESLDRLYCYVTLQGKYEQYQRIPEDEDSFLSLIGESWDLEGSAAGIHRLVFEHPEGQPVVVGMECWGWRGDELVPLGSFSNQHPEQDWGQELRGQGSGFEIWYRITNFNPWELLDALQFLVRDIPPPFDLLQPANWWECGSYVNRFNGNELTPGERAGGLWGCMDIKAEDLLVWKWPGVPDIQPSDIDGYRVYLNREYLDDPRDNAEELETWEMVGEIGSVHQMMPITKPNCAQTFAYKVTAFKRFASPEDGGTGRFVESYPSEAYAIQGPSCPQAQVEFKLEKFNAKDTNDGISLFPCFLCLPEIDTELEVFGSGTLTVMPEGRIHRIIFWSKEACGYGLGSGCPGETYRKIDDGDVLNLDNERIAIYSCTSGGNGVPPSCGVSDNSVTLALKDGDWLEYSFKLMEYDVSIDDAWCGTTLDAGGSEFDFGFTNWAPPMRDDEPIIFGPLSIEEWAQASILHVFSNKDLVSNTDDGVCRLTIRIEGMDFIP